jgi:hypothetical protein
MLNLVYQKLEVKKINNIMKISKIKLKIKIIGD